LAYRHLLTFSADGAGVTALLAQRRRPCKDQAMLDRLLTSRKMDVPTEAAGWTKRAAAGVSALRKPRCCDIRLSAGRRVMREARCDAASVCLRRAGYRVDTVGGHHSGFRS
jgi:hypothetical protein